MGLFGLGTTELVVIGLLVVLFFGAAKLPELARGLGKAKGEFEAGRREAKELVAEAEKLAK